MLTNVLQPIKPATLSARLVPLIEQIHISAHLDRWYKGSYRRPDRVILPPQSLTQKFSSDWEHELYKTSDPDKTCAFVQNLPDFKTLDSRAQELFSYRFLSKHDEFNDQLDAKLKELGFHPTDQSNAANIVRMTMRLRLKKQRYLEHYRSIPLRIAITALINDRKRSLRLLRSTNYTEFERLISALNITGFLHPDPFGDLPSENPANERKIAVRAECYQSRLTKLANLKVKNATVEQTFYQRKQNELNATLQRLASLEHQPCSSPASEDDSSSSLERATRQLEDLLQQVIRERRAEVLKVPVSDELTWYFKEAESRERYAAIQLEKAKRQLRRRR